LAHDPDRVTANRVFVGGVGNPWLGDLDFGPQFIRRYYNAGWPDHVFFEDAAISAHRVLHMLQDHGPARVIFIAGWSRGDKPGTIRRYTPDLSDPDPDDVAARLGEAAGGIIDFDHTLIVARYYKALPPDTIVVEIETENEEFTTEFSPSVEAGFEPVLEMVKREIDRPFGDPR
jgi:hydrogenase maturation protease